MMCKILIEHLTNIGKVMEKLSVILDDEVFETLSKHNPDWHSECDREFEQLDLSRRKLSSMKDELWDIMNLLDIRNIESNDTK